MKKILLTLAFFLTLLIAGCAQIADTYTSISDTLGLTPAWEKELRKNQRNKQQNDQRIAIAAIAVPDHIPEGELINHFESGAVRLKTVVKNRCFDQYLETYYENGQLQTITPLQNCLANGLSKGYQSDGTLSTEIFYVDGQAQGVAKQYAKDGSTLQEIEYKNGDPVKAIK